MKNLHRRHRHWRAQPPLSHMPQVCQQPKKAASKKIALELPTAANNYNTRTYDFAHPIRKPENLFNGRCPYWCDYYGGRMCVTKNCIEAQDDMTEGKGQNSSAIDRISVESMCVYASGVAGLSISD